MNLIQITSYKQIYSGLKIITKNCYSHTDNFGEYVEGKIQIEQGRLYFCSDNKDFHGSACRDKFGYEYSFWFGRTDDSDRIFNNVGESEFHKNIFIRESDLKDRLKSILEQIK